MTQEPGRPTGRIRLWAILGVVALFACSAAVMLIRLCVPPWLCGTIPVPPSTPDTPVPLVEGAAIVDDGEPHLGIQLSAGQPQPVTPQPVPTAAGQQLSDDEVQRILDRLPSLILEPEDRLEFRLPAESLPPPRTGETIEEPFPPPAAPTAAPMVDSGPLEVLRFAPEGEIPLSSAGLVRGGPKWVRSMGGHHRP